MGRCTKCGSSSHEPPKCNFPFKNKCKCGKWHFWSLCPKPNKEVKKEESSSEKVKAQVKVTGCKYSKNGSVLPTLTASSNKLKFRVLVDRASECSFISESALQKVKFKTIQSKVNLTIKGFNSPQKYESKLVDIKLKLGTSSELVNIQFLVIPKIRMNLELNGLNTVVGGFKNKGYELADTFLNNTSKHIGNIDIVLGADNARLVSGEDKLFGSKSLFIQSNVGILLTGNIKDLVNDIGALPSLENMICNVINVEENIEEPPVDMSVYAFLINKERSFFPDFECVPGSGSVTLSEIDGDMSDSLAMATESQLEYQYKMYIAHETLHKDNNLELDNKLVRYTLDNINRDIDGRLQVPLLWNGRVSHKLAKNSNLSKAILNSNLKKLTKNNQIELVDNVIKEQLKAGIIERVDCPDQYLRENPNYSFMPHMPIFRPNKETTKCRIVFFK